MATRCTGDSLFIYITQHQPLYYFSACRWHAVSDPSALSLPNTVQAAHGLVVKIALHAVGCLCLNIQPPMRALCICLSVAALLTPLRGPDCPVPCCDYPSDTAISLRETVRFGPGQMFSYPDCRLTHTLLLPPKRLESGWERRQRPAPDALIGRWLARRPIVFFELWGN